MPCELERKFLDILHFILVDEWEIPEGAQWISIMKYLGAFEPNSQMNANDNYLQDCRNFFILVSEIFDFEDEFLEAQADAVDFTSSRSDYESLINIMSPA